MRVGNMAFSYPSPWSKMRLAVIYLVKCVMYIPCAPIIPKKFLFVRIENMKTNAFN